MTGCSYRSISLSSCLFVSFTHIKHAWVGSFCTIIGDGGRSKGEGGLILSLPSAGIRHVSAPPFHEENIYISIIAFYKINHQFITQTHLHSRLVITMLLYQVLPLTCYYLSNDKILIIFWIMIFDIKTNLQIDNFFY